ncbi:hypothetical protein RF679_14585 [Undibacterium cyanobacteriorum]|uniref:DUF3592 domain-containing protein n=1 Tax=Undibacterium cyanobacteriorum TaxID=3073561 RepID=A0ABY9RF58_9BURK|nr:hypothetical protein [Undibacterium sp. 20NA77.5]WMW79863.1 hypothetical protein RF679_14585 [Undibacterium sp. 20NA77.5]
MNKSSYFIIIGIGIILLGLYQNYDTRSFKKYGVMANAFPHGQTYDHVKVRRGGKAGTIEKEYNDVRLEFKTQEGERVIVKKDITDAMLTELERKGSLPIRYLSTNPNRTRLSNANIDDGIGLMLFGGAIFGFGFIWRLIANFLTQPSNARRTNKHLRKTMRS